MNNEETVKKILELEAGTDISLAAVNELRATLLVFMLPQLLQDADSYIEIADAYLERFEPLPPEGRDKHLVEEMRDLIISMKTEIESNRSSS